MLTDWSATQNHHQHSLLADSANSGDDFGGLADWSVSVDNVDSRHSPSVQGLRQLTSKIL